MLKYSSLFLIPALFFTVFTGCSKSNPINSVSSQKTEFISTYGGSKNESALSIIRTTDAGYAILGFTQSNNGDVKNKTNESFDYWLLKFDANSTLQWQKNYGGTDDDRGSSIIQTLDGGYAILGYTKSNDGDITQNAGAHDFWILKLDSTGNIIWQKTFGFAGSDKGISLIQSQDNGYLITGVLDVTASGGMGNSKSFVKKHAGGDYWAIKLNADGEKQWSKFYGGTFTDTPYDGIQTEDNGFILVGSSDSNDVDIKNNKGSYDFWVIKISETGTLVWEKSFGGSEIDEARAITKTNDGNYLIVGDTRSSDLDVSTNHGAADFWIIKISPDGVLLWEKTFGGSHFDAARSVTKTQDGGFVICGSSRSANGNLSTNHGQNDAWVIKIDNNANLEWQKSIGGPDVDLANDAIQLNDKSVIVVGESSSSNIDVPENKGFSDVLIFKTEQR